MTIYISIGLGLVAVVAIYAWAWYEIKHAAQECPRCKAKHIISLVDPGKTCWCGWLYEEKP